MISLWNGNFATTKGCVMFKGFNLSLDSLDTLQHRSTYKSELTTNKEKVEKSLKNFILIDGSIDGEKLKQEWFPNIRDTHVFISHSHKDLELAEGLASWLYEQFGINSFIDSHVWGYANDLLKELDNKYALFPSGRAYSYNVRNETTSHVHMMLSNALNEVIDNSECLFFLNTENAIKHVALSKEADDHRTASPWIMSELTTSNIIRKKGNVVRYKCKPTMQSVGIESSTQEKNKALVIHHKVPTQHLIDLNTTGLKKWGKVTPSTHKKYDALTILYNNFADEMFDKNALSTPLSLESA